MKLIHVFHPYLFAHILQTIVFFLQKTNSIGCCEANHAQSTTFTQAVFALVEFGILVDHNFFHHCQQWCCCCHPFKLFSWIEIILTHGLCILCCSFGFFSFACDSASFHQQTPIFPPSEVPLLPGTASQMMNVIDAHYYNLFQHSKWNYGIHLNEMWGK